jgi:toxin CcdB
MPQFTVYENKNPSTRTAVPYLLDVQNDLLADLESRVVVPLCPAAAWKGKLLRTLMPVFEVDGQQVVLLTPQLAGIPRRELGPPVARLDRQRAEIVAALDFLVTGF